MRLVKTYADLMKDEAPYLSPDSSLLEAAQRLRDSKCRALAVLNPTDHTLAGIIRLTSMLDAFSKSVPVNTPLINFLEHAPLMVNPQDMWGFGDSGQEIIVVQEKGKLLGVIHPHLLKDYLLPRNTFLFDVLMDAIPYPLVAVDEGGITWMCNQAFAELLPDGKKGVLNRELTEVITDSQLYRVAQSGQPERWQKFKFGDRMFLANRTPLIVDGRHVGALASLHDISELEQISNELRSVRMLTEELDAIIESSFDGIYVTDGQGKTLRVNKAYERITGLKGHEVIGYTMHELVEQNVFDQSTTISVLATGLPCTIFQKIRNGATVIASGTPIFDNNGNIVRVVTTVRDLTELNQLRDQLNAADTLKTQYEEELRTLKYKLNQLDDDEVIAHSPTMRHLLALALHLGSVDSTVLIQGESGVGKELIASIIHHNSSRKEKPFVKINCAAILETLLESELFGYARGAFTGANREGKSGLFEAANGGTMLLDEIGDLPLSLQAKLLRVLQERQTRRLGDNVARDIDVRIIAATNQNLSTLIQAQRFRSDLYYRLNVVPVLVPPLRERGEDIVFLTQFFLQKFCSRYARPKKLHPELMPMLLAHNWPGNVRELENLVERLVVTSMGAVIKPEDMPASIRQLGFSGQLSLDIEGKTLKEIIEIVELKTLHLAFSKHKSTRRVARALGINQSSVVRKSKKFNLFT